jgi:hypothetical protein
VFAVKNQRINPNGQPNNLTGNSADLNRFTSLRMFLFAEKTTNIPIFMPAGTSTKQGSRKSPLKPTKTILRLILDPISAKIFSSLQKDRRK